LKISIVRKLRKPMFGIRKIRKDWGWFVIDLGTFGICFQKKTMMDYYDEILEFKKNDICSNCGRPYSICLTTCWS